MLFRSTKAVVRFGRLGTTHREAFAHHSSRPQSVAAGERATRMLPCVPSAPGKWAKLHLWYQLQSSISRLNEMKLQRGQSRQRWMQRLALLSDHEPIELVAQSLCARVTPQ